jgi:hypothetical protein
MVIASEWTVMTPKSTVQQRAVRQLPVSMDMSTEAEEDIVSSHYLATSEQTEDFMCAVIVVIYTVCELVRTL